LLWGLERNSTKISIIAKHEREASKLISISKKENLDINQSIWSLWKKAL